MEAAPPTCPHRPPCPGCPKFGQSLATLATTQSLRDWAERQAADCRFTLGPAAPPLGYRHRARLAVRGRSGSPKLGIFQRGSHRIVDIPRCLVQHPRINHVSEAVKQAIKRTGLAPYADAPHRGLVRYLQIMVHPDPESAQVQLVVTANDTTPERCQPLLDQLTEDLGDQLDGLFWNGQPTRQNHILGPHWAHIAGRSAMAVEIAGARVFFPPAAFSQNNPVVYGHIATQVGAWIPDDSDVLELYAGVGALGLSVLPRVRRVRFNELSAGSLAGLALGLQALSGADRARTEALPGPAGDQLQALPDADTVIVDPPRKGLDAGLPEALGGPDGPDTLVYVSCGPHSFMADAEAITRAGRLRLSDLMVFDLFPWTGHVEVLARFARR